MNLHVREDPRGYDEDIASIARALLLEHELVAGGLAHRIIELEAYYFGERHRDPFAHRDPRQLEPGRWYFHRKGGTLRGGSWKGLDLTFGRPGTYGGVLLRSVRGPDGALVSGPSLLVDHLIEVSGATSVKDLAARAEARVALDPSNVLHLRRAAPREAAILRTARVGLTLKRFARDSSSDAASMPEHVLRPDRFLSEPRAIKKGRVQTILALHEEGEPIATIQARTGSPRAAIERVVEAYTRGLSDELERFAGRDLGPLDLARMHGAWRARSPMMSR